MRLCLGARQSYAVRWVWRWFSFSSDRGEFQKRQQDLRYTERSAAYSGKEGGTWYAWWYFAKLWGILQKRRCWLTSAHAFTQPYSSYRRTAAAIFFSNLGDLMILNTALKFSRNSGIIIPKNSPNKMMQYRNSCGLRQNGDKYDWKENRSSSY